MPALGTEAELPVEEVQTVEGVVVMFEDGTVDILTDFESVLVQLILLLLTVTDNVNEEPEPAV